MGRTSWAVLLNRPEFAECELPRVRHRGYGGKLLTYPSINPSDIKKENYVPPRTWTDPYTHKRVKEHHLRGQNFAGPGTQITRRLKEHIIPTTFTDAGAQRHDIDYYNARDLLRRGKISRNQAEARVRSSDKKLVDVAKKQVKSKNKFERTTARKVMVGIRGKMGLENVGLMSKSKFLGAGVIKYHPLMPQVLKDEHRVAVEAVKKKKKKNKDPTRRLKKKMIESLSA